MSVSSKPIVTLVVPTIREASFRDFVARWGPLGLFARTRLILVEDNPAPTFDLEGLLGPHQHLPATHFSWQDIEWELGTKSWIIPRRSDTVRSYGYLKAWQSGCDFVMTLDDDCYPPSQAEDGVEYASADEFVDGHISWLTRRTRWYNTLNSVTPRGVPYFNRGVNDRIIVNHGLWTNVLDYDAPRQLVAPAKERFSHDNQVVPHSSYFPMCGMNVAWRRDATVLMYHLLMGSTVQYVDGTRYKKSGLALDARVLQREGALDGPPLLKRLPFDRFGDIWCGIIMKKIADEHGYNVTTGTPYIRHERASNPFANLKKEANGLEVNERFWQYIDDFSLPRDMLKEEHKLRNAYVRMAEHVGWYDEFPEHREYFMMLGSAMKMWANLFIRRDGLEKAGT